MNPGPAGTRQHCRASQAGMALLLCLLFLTALTLLGLSAVGDTTLQNRLTANFQEQERANQSALAALAWAEQWLLKLPGPAPAPCMEACEGLYLHTRGSLPTHPEFEDLPWWQTHGHEAGIDPLTDARVALPAAGSIHPPMWVLEMIHEVPPGDGGSTDLQTWYRVLVRATGHTDAGVSVIESIITRPWPEGAETEDADTTGPQPGDGISICDGAEVETACGRLSWRELR